MSESSLTESVRSALKKIGTTLDADSPAIPSILSILADFQITAQQFATKWDSIRYSHKIKIDQSNSQSINQLLKLIRDAFQAEKERKKTTVKSNQSINLVHSKVRQSINMSLMDLLDGDMLDDEDDQSNNQSNNQLLPRVKAEPMSDDDTDTQPINPALNQSIKQELSYLESNEQSKTIKQQYQSDVSSNQSNDQSKPSPDVIACQYDANAAKLDDEASAQPINQSNRLNIEHILTPGEVEDLDSSINQSNTQRPFRYLFMRDELMRDAISERAEIMQNALMQTEQYSEMCQSINQPNNQTNDQIMNKTTSPTNNQADNESTSQTNSQDQPSSQSEIQPNSQPNSQSIKQSIVDDLDGLNFDDVGLSSTAARSANTVIVSGRIVNSLQENDTKLNVKTLFLEGDAKLSISHRIALRVAKLSKFSFFPGQCILAKGVNETGKAMVVEDVIQSAPLHPVALTQSQVRSFNGADRRALVVMSAAGPFSANDNLAYEPLFDLIDRCVKWKKPDVLILQGPFVDADHPLIAKGTQDPQVLFDGLMAELANRLQEVSEHTRLVLQPHPRDAHHLIAAFPQPPFSCHSVARRNWQTVPNPCQLRVNDLTIGLSSIDVLSQLAASEINMGQEGSRIPRLQSQLLAQQSFFPLFPAPNENESIDWSHTLRFQMCVSPSLLITPSVLAKFVAEIGQDCIGVNSGPLIRGKLRGSYALATLHVKSEPELKSGEQRGGLVTEHLIKNRIHVACINI